MAAVGPSLAVTLLDNDVAAIVASPTSVAVREGDATPVSVNVTLSSRPYGPVLVRALTRLGQTSAAPAALTFTPGVCVPSTASWTLSGGGSG